MMCLWLNANQSCNAQAAHNYLILDPMTDDRAKTAGGTAHSFDHTNSWERLNDDTSANFEQNITKSKGLNAKSILNYDIFLLHYFNS